MEIKRYFNTHGPAISATVGVISMIAGTVLAIKVTPHAIEKVKKADISKDATKKEKVISTTKAVWKYYLPVAALELGGAAFIFSSVKVFSDRCSNLSSAFYMTDIAYKNLQNTMEEKLTSKQVEEIRSDIAKKEIDKNPPPEEHPVSKEIGEHWFYDSMTGQWFWMTDEKFNRIVNRTNARINSELYIQMNEFLAELNENPNKTHEALVWGPGQQLDLKSQFETRNGLPVTVIQYNLGGFSY